MTRHSVAILLLALAVAPWADAVSASASSEQSSAAQSRANPIRKVVTMLQSMQKKVSQEAEKAEELFEKYQCYCKTAGGDLTASVEAASAKISDLGPSIEASINRKDQTEQDLKSHQTDRDAADKAMAEATALREKEKAAFDKALAESKTNLAGLNKAVAALEKGMAGSFLQTNAASLLRQYVSDHDMFDVDRQSVLAFLSGKGGDEYAPQSGEIVGILKQLGDEMDKDQQDMIATEGDAVKTYEELMAAKKKEVAALSKSIEEKQGRIGRLGVEIASMQNDLSDTQETSGEDKAFLADMKKNCDAKAGLHEEEKKMRSQEVVALADTIKILNDDDALDLFKKTLPSAGSSFVQLQTTTFAMRAKASALLEQWRSAPGQDRQRIDLISLALRGRKVGFSKVLKLIDELVATLKKEMNDDEHKKEYCTAQFDKADDKKKALEHAVADMETSIEDTKEGIETMAEEIKALKAGIVDLDKAVAEATEQRKAENIENKELVASNGAAKELILFAKNRLQKFYNPKMYKAPPKRELSEGDRIYENNGGEIPAEAPGGIAGTGIEASFLQVGSSSEGAPPPPPETAAAYMKKSEESGGVMQMMDLLVKDLDMEITEAETEEKAAQADYETTMKDSGEKRALDSKSLTDKEASKADLQSELESIHEEKGSSSKELMATDKYIMTLHGECDWLLQYFDVRKQARADEIDSLEKAKAVLSGADFALLQKASIARSRKFLHRA